MSSNTTRKSLEDYFRSMNSISEKLVDDLRLSCKDEKWGLFPNEDEALVQWRKFVDPRLEDKYRLASNDEISVSCFPVFILKSGEKLVIDEDTSNGRPFGSSWKDEHSSPFSWETESQLNLLLLGDEGADTTDGQPCTPKTPPSARSFRKLPTPKVTPRPSPALTRKSMKIPAEQIIPVQPKVAPVQPKVAPVLPKVAPVLPKVAPSQSNDKCEKISVKCPDVPPQQAVVCEDIKQELIVQVDNGKPVVFMTPSKADLTLPINDDNQEEEESIQVEEDAASVSSLQLDAETPSKSIPKTGFDFLDNW